MQPISIVIGEMIKRLLLCIALITTVVTSAQKNPLLSHSFWEGKPSVADVQKQVERGADATVFDARMFDATTLAILNEAPYETIVYLLSLKGNGVEKRTHDKRTYLFWAAHSDNVPIVRYLLDKGAKTDVRDSRGQTPLIFAAARGNVNPELYDLLLKHGASIKETNNQGANALLLLAPHFKNIEETRYFTKKGLSLKSVDKDGNNAIFYAATLGNKAMMEAFAKKKVKAKALNDKGENLFFAAARGGRSKRNGLEVFQYIEALGVDPSQKSKEGVTPLLIVAERSRDVEVIRFFIEKGNDVNQRDSAGNTPLIKAAERNALPVVTLLAEKVSDINAQNKAGQSALTQAVATNRADVVRLLLQKGADAKIKDLKGNTLAYYLLRNFNPHNSKDFNEKWRLLSEAGMDWTQPQGDGSTLYHLAIETGDADVFAKVAELPIDINAKNAEGLTALHKAAMRAKDLYLIKELLNKGANPAITTDLGETAYDLARENEALKDVDVNFLK